MNLFLKNNQVFPFQDMKWLQQCICQKRPIFDQICGFCITSMWFPTEHTFKGK